MTTQFPYTCDCCGTPLKHPHYFQGKIYGETCIAYVTDAKTIHLMKQYNVNSVEEAQKLHSEYVAKSKAEHEAKEMERATKKAERTNKGKMNGEIYELLTTHIENLKATGEPVSYYQQWKNTLEEKALNELTSKQQEAVSELYATLVKEVKGIKTKKDDLRFEFGVKHFGWVESNYDLAIAKLKKLKFEKIQEIAIQLEVPEAEECENNRYDKKYLIEEIQTKEGFEALVLA